MPDENDIKIKSIKKTIDVLNCFIYKQPLGVTEISEMLGTYKSGVHRILTSLTALNYLEQDKDSGKYYLGYGALQLSRAVGNRFNFHDIAVKYAKMLADEVNEIVRISLPMNHDVYYLDVVYPSMGHYSVGCMISPSDPMHCTSCGKAMMAYMPESFVDDYFTSPLLKCTQYTITDKDLMKQELCKIREQGYATDENEAAENVTCIGVAIRNRSNNVIGALSISGGSNVFTDEKRKELSHHLIKYSRFIENNI